MAFGTPYPIGTNTPSTAASQPVSVVHAVAVGDAIVVDCGNSSSSGATVTGVADSKSNSYSRVGTAVTSSEFGDVWMSSATTALTTSDTITVTYSTTTGEKGVLIAGFPGVATSSAVDQDVTAHASSAAPSVTSGTLSQATEMAIGILNTASAGGVPTGLGSFTSVQTFQSGTSPEMTIAYFATSATTAVTWSATITSTNWAAILITVLPASGGGASVTLPTAALTLAAPAGSVSAGASVALPAAPLALAAPAGTPSGPAAVFPQVQLGQQIELNVGGWTSITSYVNGTGTPKIMCPVTRGRQNENTQLVNSSCAMQWSNTDGRFDPDYPLGPWYGLLGLNTPVRVSVPWSSTYLRFDDDATSSATAPDTAGLQITGSIDVRVDLQLNNFVPSVLCSKWGGSGKAWALSLNGDGSVTFTWFDGTHINQVSTAGLAVLPLGRSMIRVTLNASTGTVQFFTAAAMGTGTLLAAVTGSGATSVSAAAGQAVAVGASATFDASFGTQGCQGRVYEFRVYSGIAGTLEAGPVFTAQTAGATSFTDGQGNTWTLNGTASLSGRSFRYHGECSALPQEWDPSGHDIWTMAATSGITRRLQAGNSPVRSVMRRGIPAWPSIPSASMTSLGSLPSTIAYWPCEDAAGSTQIASGLAANSDGNTVPPMTVAGAAGFQGTAGSPSADSVFACSAQLAQIGSSTWTGRVPAYSGGAVMCTFLLGVPSGGLSGTPVLIALNFNNGTQLLLRYSTASGGTLTLSSVSGSTTFVIGSVTGVNGQGLMVQVGNISTGTPVAFLNTVLTGLGQSPTSVSAASIAPSGQLASVVVNPAGAACGATELGHIWVEAAFSNNAGSQDALPALSDPRIAALLNAYTGEAAGTRVARLCAENGIASRVYGYPLVTAPMQAQQIDTLMNVLQSCEDADRGQLFEPRTVLGLGYRTLASMCNQPPGVTLDYSLGEVSPPLKPTRDDLQFKNDVTLSRNNGSSYQYQVTSGQLSVNPPPAGAGDYDTSLTVYVQLDTQLPGIAAWIAHVGTPAGKRYPVIYVDLASTDANMQAVLPAVRDLDIGDHVQIINTPHPLLPPGTVDQLAWGFTEDIGDLAWRIAVNGVPEQPYEVAVAGTGASDSAHADTDGSQLHASISSTAASMLVDTTGPSGILWTTSGADFPFTIMMAGELIKVTNITGSSSPQTFTITRSQNGVVKAQTAGAPVNVWPPPVAALSGAA